VDNVDLEIINLLKKNARISASEISKEVKLSIPAVSERLRKLERCGAIEKYTVILNPKFFSKDLTAIMFISLIRPEYTEKFSNFVKGEDEILECYYIAGDFDYCLKIITHNTYTLEKLLNRIKSIKGVQKTKTIVTLSTIKNNHSISTTAKPKS
jgi:Lrp/AsnC family transcriptional regulator, leucine-responsive regulatory protein